MNMFKSLTGLLTATLAFAGGATYAAEQPNLVLILADDLGWMDVNPTAEFATGTPPDKQYYETPHIDQLAKDGISFSRGYSMPLCTPSRATILTGRNGATFGFNNAAGMRGYKKQKPTFLAQGLEPLPGYFPLDQVPAAKSPFPVRVPSSNHALPNGLPDTLGFKVHALPEMLPMYRSAFLGKWHLGGANMEGHRPQDFGFEAITYEDEGWSSYHKGARKKWHEPGPPAQKDYLTDDLTALSTDWIRRHVKEQPEKPFLLYLAHFAIHGPIQARPKDVAYFEKKKTRGWNGQANPTYAGMIRALDDSVGAIRETLRELGIADNTVIVFASDNGAHAQKKGEHWTSNTPLRGQKAQIFEGGIRVPMFAYVPGNKEKGLWVHTPVSLEDVAPTLLDLGGVEPPEKIQAQWTGKSLVPLLDGDGSDFKKREIFIHEPYYRPDELTDGNPMMPPSTAMIDGDHKMIAFHDGSIRLYDLSKDIGETNDLSASMPERADRMLKRIMQWRVEQIPARYDTSANQNTKSKQVRPELFVR